MFMLPSMWRRAARVPLPLIMLSVASLQPVLAGPNIVGAGLTSEFLADSKVAMQSTNVRNDNDVLLSFATVGDSRAEEGAAELTAQDKIWLQNTPVITRIAREVEHQRPNFFFFNGDMIMGYKTDSNYLNRQYAFWRGMMSGLLESGTYLIPVPGNHEVQEKTKDPATGKTVKLARQSNEDAWRANMGDLIIDATRWNRLLGESPGAWSVENTPTVGGPDGITTDQRQLSYSFDFRQAHFTVINTDAVGQDGRAPVQWLAQDLAAAQQRGAKYFFVFGHKPAYSYKYSASMTKIEGFDQFPDNQKAFWDLMEQYSATYFCGHQHIFHIEQPRAADGGHAYQVLVGSGGSPLDSPAGETSVATDHMYAWVGVELMRAGELRLTAYGFDEPRGPARPIEVIKLPAIAQ